jgi:solute carrier family 45, member 1/2/4
MNRNNLAIDVNEQSPLISPQPSPGYGNDSTLEAGRNSPLSPLSDVSALDDHDFKTDSPLESRSVWYLILLTLPLLGLQVVWSVELSNGSPYLLSLGMSKALVAFVWVAGPVTGVLVQPYIGLKSDRCRVSWGRRKPFMIGGTLGTALTSLLLAYAKELMSIFGGLGEDAKYEGSWRTMTIIFATVLMWCLDFSINTVQAAIRAFIVDGAPAHQQEDANAWASRLVGVGNVIGYVFGYLNLPQYFSFFGDTQFKVLVTIASISLVSTIVISTSIISERNPQLDPPPKVPADEGVLAFFKQAFVAVKRLPPRIRQVCVIQFCYWFGWFPFLFYITTYIGQLYVNPDLHPGLTEDEVEALWAKATRIGTLALLIYAITSFGANILLPFLVVPSYKRPQQDADETITPTSPIGFTRASHAIADSPEASTHQERAVLQYRHDAKAHPPTVSRRCLAMLQIRGLTLRRTWLVSQLLFVVCMLSTFAISTWQAATAMTAFVGICWSLTLWAPFALISAEISERDERRRRHDRQKLMGAVDGNDYGDEEIVKDDEPGDEAGIILGIHNVAVSAPQIFATMICSAIFKALQKPRDEPGDTSVGWTLRLSAVAALVAALLTFRMKEPGQVR